MLLIDHLRLGSVNHLGLLDIDRRAGCTVDHCSEYCGTYRRTNPTAVVATTMMTTMMTTVVSASLGLPSYHCCGYCYC